MKGRTVIQLFEAETKENVLSLTEDNLVTNALADFINFLHKRLGLYEVQDPYGTGYMYYMQPNGGAFLKNAVKGLLLCEQALDATASNYFISENFSPLIGYAGGDYAGADPFRGDFNASESVDITNGIRLVWDFASDKANGTIRSACLCPERMGSRNIGLRSSTDFPAQRSWLHSVDLNENTILTQDYSQSPSGFASTAAMAGWGVFIGRIGTKAYYASGASFNSTITVKSVDLPNPTVFSFADPTYKTTTSVIGTLAAAASTGREFIIHNSELWMIAYHYGTHAKTMQKLSLTTLAVLQTITIGSTAQTTYGDRGQFAKVGNLICMITPSTGVIQKYNIADGTYAGTVTIPGGEAAYTWTRLHKYGPNSAVVLKAVSCSRPGYIFNGTSFLPISLGIENEIDCFVRYTELDPFLVVCNGNSRARVGVDCNFLSTINNLSSPVTKNNTQTMKVTYELTW